jgi:transcriptional regulator with XRE-family HTH domain
MGLRKYSSPKVGNNIRRIRQALHMSQEEFGKFAGDYSQDTVAKWEAGQVPHALTLGRISKAVNITVDSILGYSKLTTAKIVLKRKARKTTPPVQKRNLPIVRGGVALEISDLSELSQNCLEDTRLFQYYCGLMTDGAWNTSLSALYASRSYEAGLHGAWLLAELTERFKNRLLVRQYEKNLISIALLELTCLDRLDLPEQYLDAWEKWRGRPLYLTYKASKADSATIGPFIGEKDEMRLRVHFLYLVEPRKLIVERTLGRPSCGHARQEDLSDDEIRERLSRIK